MPILKNALKALRSSKRKAIVNSRIKSKVKTFMNKMKEKANQENLQEIYSQIDKAVKKKVFHKNKGARLKKQMAKLLA